MPGTAAHEYTFEWDPVAGQSQAQQRTHRRTHTHTYTHRYVDLPARKALRLLQQSFHEVLSFNNLLRVLLCHFWGSDNSLRCIQAAGLYMRQRALSEWKRLRLAYG